MGFRLDVSLDYIQTIRLAQTLLEAGCHLQLDARDRVKFARLEALFGIDARYDATAGDVKPLPGVAIDHETPMTCVGRIRRPLIFPHYIFAYLRQRWPQVRRHRVTFAGLMTDARIGALNDWLSRYDATRRPLPRIGVVSRFANKVRSRLNLDSERRFARGDALFQSSNRGRRFPEKSWDSGYFDLLLNSQFTLCPSGDYVWSYRFIEAAMCGSIPVVEKECELFEGFRLLTMSDTLRGATWSVEDAEYNFHLAQKRVSVPPDMLRAEVERLLALEL
jgi:hypothetical protein